MWPKNYFAARYWPGRYFPPVKVIFFEALNFILNITRNRSFTLER